MAAVSNTESKSTGIYNQLVAFCKGAWPTFVTNVRDKELKWDIEKLTFGAKGANECFRLNPNVHQLCALMAVYPQTKPDDPTKSSVGPWGNNELNIAESYWYVNAYGHPITKEPEAVHTSAKYPIKSSSRDYPLCAAYVEFIETVYRFRDSAAAELVRLHQSGKLHSTQVEMILGLLERSTKFSSFEEAELAPITVILTQAMGRQVSRGEILKMTDPEELCEGVDSKVRAEVVRMLEDMRALKIRTQAIEEMAKGASLPFEFHRDTIKDPTNPKKYIPDPAKKPDLFHPECFIGSKLTFNDKEGKFFENYASGSAPVISRIPESIIRQLKDHKDDKGNLAPLGIRQMRVTKAVWQPRTKTRAIVRVPPAKCVEQIKDGTAMVFHWTIHVTVDPGKGGHTFGLKFKLNEAYIALQPQYPFPPVRSAGLSVVSSHLGEMPAFMVDMDDVTGDDGDAEEDLPVDQQHLAISTNGARDGDTWDYSSGAKRTAEQAGLDA